MIERADRYMRVRVYYSLSNMFFIYRFSKTLIKKDFFSGYKLGQFSIFDPTKNRLLYRIESYYKIEGKLERIDHVFKTSYW
jgi:hypothetical protein